MLSLRDRKYTIDYPVSELLLELPISKYIPTIPEIAENICTAAPKALESSQYKKEDLNELSERTLNFKEKSFSCS